MTALLAIDQGTTGTKALVVDEDLQVRGQAYAEFTQHYPRPGWVEHDPGEIWRVSVEVAGRALEDAGAATRDIVAVGVTNQRETTVLWDRVTGTPVANAIVWQDRRTAEVCARLAADGAGAMVRERTGLVLDPYFSGTKVAWLLDHVDGLRARAADGDIAFGTIDSWLLWNLTAGAAHVTDPTNASRTMLFDIYARRWDDELLALLDVPRSVLPELRANSAMRDSTDPDAFLGLAVPVAGVVGDQQSALFAQACFSPGLAKNTYGTGSFLLMNTGPSPRPVTEGPLATIAWELDDSPAEYAAEGAMFVTGSAVQWLRDGLGIIADAAETEPLARSLASNDDVYFVPALTGLGAPHWDPYARGTIVGLTRGSTRAHLARATLESIAYQTADVVAAMETAVGERLTELRVDGGAVVNAFLMQFQADILGVPVVVPEITETTALGSAFMAGLAAGVWRDRDELSSRWRVRATYEPRMSADERATLLSRWRAAVERAREWAQPDRD